MQTRYPSGQLSLIALGKFWNQCNILASKLSHLIGEGAGVSVHQLPSIVDRRLLKAGNKGIDFPALQPATGQPNRLLGKTKSSDNKTQVPADGMRSSKGMKQQSQGHVGGALPLPVQFMFATPWPLNWEKPG